MSKETREDITGIEYECTEVWMDRKDMSVKITVKTFFVEIPESKTSNIS